MSSTDISMHNILLAEVDKLCPRLLASVVFVDDGFTEVLHWLGGAEMLLSYGVSSIRSFSPFEGGSEEEQTAVVFLSSPYQENEESTVKDIISNSHFHSVSIITNVHPAIQAIVRFKLVNDEEVTEIVEGIEGNIYAWIKDTTGVQGKAEFVYIPLCCSVILSSSLFTIPSHSSFFPLTPYQLNLLSLRNKMAVRPSETPRVEFEHLPKEMQLQYKLLVSSLNSLCECLQIDEEIFSIGVSSGIVADELAALTWRESRKSSKKKASLLLIDRTIDLATPSHHPFESTLDRILSTLPPATTTTQHDVCIDLSPIYSPPPLSTDHPAFGNNDDNTLHGSLSQGADNRTSTLLNSLLLLKQKEMAMHLNRALSTMLMKEALLPPGTNAKGIGLDGLLRNISFVKNNDDVIRRHSGLLQLILAFVQASKCQRQKSLEKLQRIENLILLFMGDDDNDHGGRGGGGDDDDCLPLMVLKEFRKIRDADANLPLDDLLTLLLHMFAINDVTMTSRQQQVLEDGLTEELVAASRKEAVDGFIRWDVECGGREGDCRLVAQEVITQLKWLSHARLPLRSYKSVVSKGTLTFPPTHQPIMKQILNDVTDRTNQLPDLKRRTTGLGDILKSGFGFLMGAAQKEAHPLDHPVLVVFVLGGVSLGEVKMVADHFAAKKFQGQVIVGGTTILTPKKLTQLTLFNQQSCLL